MIAVMAGDRGISSGAVLAAVVVEVMAGLPAATADRWTNHAAPEITTVDPAHQAPVIAGMIDAAVAAAAVVATARIAGIAHMAARVAAGMTAVAVMATGRALSSRPWLRSQDSPCMWNLKPRPRKPWRR